MRNGSASKTLTSNSYDSRNRLTSALYGNGQRVNYRYDSLDRPVIKYYNNDNPNNAGYHTVYNANGLVGLHKDVVNTQRTRYTYDLAQRLVRVRRNVGVLGDNGAFLAELAYTYENNTNRLSAYTLELLLGSGTSKVKTSFTYGNKNGSQMTDAVYEVRQNGGLHKTYTYDGLGRKTQTMMSMGGANKPIRYTYVGVAGNRTTTMLECLDNFGEKLSYTYDANGNIETIRKNGVLQETYHYDGLNQLVRADSAAQNKSFVYTYDAGGNILSVKEYAYTTGALGTAVKTVNYGYTDGTWKDLLTSYAGQTITYDGIGNPLSYRDGLSMTWRNGRELASLTKNGVTASYLYDESGLRTKKTVGGVVTNYHVINGVLYGEYTDSHRLLYMFDEAGTRYSFLYNGSTYYYVFNGQGDVIGITDGYGNMLARYTYDAWGKPLTITDGAGNDVSGNASHIANINPFRYRGYYYDKESGLYYLQSRYYDPVVGRFINADAILGANGDMSSYNMFAYCGNNPIVRADPTGSAAVVDDVVIGIIIVCVFLLASTETALYSQAPTWGNNALQIPDNRQKNKILPFPPILPSPRKNPQPAPAPKPKQEEPKRKKGTVYYHVTSRENAILIICSGQLIGSKQEAGHVFAFRSLPSKKAAMQAGLRDAEVAVRFVSSRSFMADTTVDRSLLPYGPVVSCAPGPLGINSPTLVELY